MRPVCDFAHTRATSRRVDLPIQGVGFRRRLALRREDCGKNVQHRSGRGSASLCRLLAPSRHYLGAEGLPLSRVKRSFRWISRYPQNGPEAVMVEPLMRDAME